jgi:YVTN family beta-propeller protein
MVVFVVMIVSLPLPAQDSPLYALPQNEPVFLSSSMALTPARRYVVANRLTNSVSVVAPDTGTIEAEIAVGRDPRSVAVTPDGTRFLVVNRADGTLSVIDANTNTLSVTYPLGSQPFAVVANNTMAYISVQGSSDIIGIDFANGTIVTRILTPAFPAGLALWGDFLYVTHFWSGAFSLIYLPTAQVVRTIQPSASAGLSANIEIDVRAGIAYLPQSILNHRLLHAPYDALMLPVVQVVDLATMQPLRRYDLRWIDRPVNMPFAAKLTNDRSRLLIANAGSNDVTALDLASGRGAGFLPTGSFPQAVLFSRDGQAVYVHNGLDNTLIRANLRFLTADDIFPTTLQTAPANIQIGAQLFYSAADDRMSAGQAVSCAACHFDGQSDGRVWWGFNTPALYALDATAPYSWIGTWNDLTAVNEHLRVVQAGRGLAGVDFDALLSYIRQLPIPRSPITPDAAGVQRGAQLFAELNCGSCHAGERGTDNLAYDVGTGGQFRTPPLLALWLTAPYLHDGTAPDLRALLTTGQGIHRLPPTLPDADIAALIQYLLSRN